MRTRTRIGAAAAVALAAAATGWTSPATAEVIERERFDVSYSEEIELCGLTLQLDGRTRGSFSLRAGGGDDDTFFFEHTVERVADTITNPATGRFFTTTGRRVLQDVQATRVEGSIFRVTLVEAGQPLLLRDMSGDVVLRDRGVIRRTFLFDTGGDDVPGGDFVANLAVRVAGPHPDFFLEDEARCAMVHELLG
jgi:hypothetical protein